MATAYGLDDIFGDMPFDHFLVDKWDPESPLNQEAQERTLMKTWISLGRNGRSTYIQRCREDWLIPVPDYIPTDLAAFEKRKTVEPSKWSNAGAIWIRTWYGNEAEERDQSLVAPGMHGFDDIMFGPYIFDDNAAAYGVLARDADDEVELMDEIPPFILSALMRCPDAMEGGGGDYAADDEELAWSQSLLVVVADREACEDGWVLLIATNDRGQALHMRVRCKASLVGENVTFWKDGGEPLDIGNRRENLMDYLDPNQSGDGWDDG
ncbi:hypothetical protein HRS9139_00959 [Pyrenophora teres f. teres]|nr:hypothetical protein HRS9139_00959 [Pyrenophora teres f. teres]